jgi:hypothetical protein
LTGVDPVTHAVPLPPAKPGSLETLLSPGEGFAAEPRGWPGSSPAKASKESSPKIGNWEYAYSAAAAIPLNNSLIAAVVHQQWRRRMQLRQAFATRDQMNKQALFEKLSDDPMTMKVINEAFREGERNWFRHMAAIFGQAEAQRVRESLDNEI